MEYYSWGNSTESAKIFKMQKRAIRIISGMKKRHSCRDLFKKLKILPFSLTIHTLTPVISGT
jgi:hypothetical protein